MRVFVTGVAGFIGSAVTRALLERGHDVLGIDCFVDFYPRRQKEANLHRLRSYDRFRFEEVDLSTVEMRQLSRWLSEYPLVSHQAAQAGVRSSWGDAFSQYLQHNVQATQRLLEAARNAGIARLVYASSSSVYGEATAFPLREDGPALPVSPYGVTKLAAEHLVRLYFVNHGVPNVSLRYFTVYGPGQRPDMAFHRLLRSLLLGQPFTLYGTGEQSRSFTFIDDVVEANLRALMAGLDGRAKPFLGEAINIGGGSLATMNEVISLGQTLSGRRLYLARAPAQKGDVSRTEADLFRAGEWLRYSPQVGLEQGLAAELRWLEQYLGRNEGCL